MHRPVLTSIAVLAMAVAIVLAGGTGDRDEAVAGLLRRKPSPTTKAPTTTTSTPTAPTTTTTLAPPTTTTIAPTTTTTTSAPLTGSSYARRVSAGGTTAYTDPAGRVWSADVGYVGGAPADRTSSPISGTDADPLYQKHRWAMPSYSLDVPCVATYRVELHFAETYWYAPGQRVFSVSAESATRLADVDVVAAVGKEAALVRTFDVTVNDGDISLGFTPKVDQPMVSAIQATQVGACATTPPPPPPTPPTYDVPVSIAANCSRPVDAEIRSWLATVPDNAVARFAADGCYGQDATIVLSDRTNLTVDGNGSTFHALTPGDIGRRNWRLQGGSGITLKNMTVRGANPRAGITEGSYDPLHEYQHGYSVEGTQGATLDGVKAFDVYGDFVTVHHDERYNPYTTDPARNVTIRNAHFERSGRQGVAPTNVEGFVLENSYLGAVNMNAVDVELDFDEARGKNIRISGNTFGAVRFSVLANVGAGFESNVGPVVLDRNTMVGPFVSCRPPVHVEASPDRFRSGYRITDNRFLTLGDAFDFIGGKDVTISGNTVSFTFGGCGTAAGVGLVNSHGVSVTSNSFSGAAQPVKQDSLSTRITSSGNTL